MAIKTLSEGVDYELVPSLEGENEQSWDVRILKGDFVESVIRFGNIAFDGENGCLNFNFILKSSPVLDLNEDDIALQDQAAEILQSILEDAYASQSLVMGNPEDESED
jgi:hypothetical protein